MKGELLLFNDKNLWKLISDNYSVGGGAYKVVAARDGKRIPISRFLGTDKEGILYIGKETSFVVRVIDLKKSISPDYNGTSLICGKRYKSLPNISELFPFEILHIELFTSNTPEQLENEQLYKYKHIYGEVPPLNAI